MAMRRELLTWDDVDRLIKHLLPQFDTEFEAMVMISAVGLSLAVYLPKRWV